MAIEWYEHWFDTDYYHILYSHHDESEAGDFLKKLLASLDLPSEAKVIDIGCGRGRHSLFLSRLGYTVTGIDIASGNISHAKRFENDNLHFHCFDKRKVFRETSFDLALNLFTSFGYSNNRKDLQEAMISMCHNLRPGGKFVLDYLNSLRLRDENFGNEQIERGGLIFNIRKYINSGQVVKEIEVREGGNVSKFVEKVHLLNLSDFEELFQGAAMKILHTFGSYQLDAYKPDHSERLILIAEKE